MGHAIGVHDLPAPEPEGLDPPVPQWVVDVRGPDMTSKERRQCSGLLTMISD